MSDNQRGALTTRTRRYGLRLSACSAIIASFGVAPAAAQLASGGDGGGGTGYTSSAPGVGGTAGAGFGGTAGSSGGIGTSAGGGGGGGGSAGGGAGGAGSGGTAGGASAGSNGAVGTISSTAGGGGGGGAGGNNGNGSGAASINNAATLNGGAGGNGGDGGYATGSNSAVNSGGGGGGGGGGYGAIVTGATSNTNTGTISGGAGGAGGGGGAPGTLGGAYGYGGNGGAGGVGIYLAAAGVALDNSGHITGGNGGGGGAGWALAALPGVGGVGVYFSGTGAALANSGTIAGGTSSLDYYNFSSGGAGVFGTGLTIRNSGTISGGNSSDRNRGADAITFAGGANYLTTNTGGSYTGNISISNANSGSLTLLQTAAGGATSSATYSNAFTGAGGLIVTTDSGYKVTLSGANTHSGGTFVTSGFLQMSGAGTLGAATGTTTISGGTLDLGQTTQTQAGVNLAGGTLQNGALNAAINSSGGNINGIGGSANLTTTSGTTVALGNNTYGGATAVGGGMLKGGAANTFSAVSATTVAAGGVINLNDFDQVLGSLAGAGTVALGSATLTVGGLGTSTTFSGTLSGTGGLTKTGAGILTLGGANTYSGSTIITAGSVQLSGAGTLGAATGTTTISGGGTLDLGSTTQTQAAVNLAGGTLQNGMLNGAMISAGGTISDIGGTTSLTTTSGTTVLLGSNAYGGATAVNGGVLEVDGAITGTSRVTVGSGGTLTGTGLVDPLLVTISTGGALAPGAAGVPGTAMTIEGNLAFQSGALYVVYLNPTATTFAKVTGTASLAGTVQANFAPGSYLTRQYIILQSSGLSGSFSDLVTANLPAGFAASLAYSGTDVLLNLFAALPPDNLNLNQRSVANGINSYFNSGGALPPSFISVFRLTGGALANALTQLDGEAHTGAQHGAFQLTSEFLALTLDPFVQGRSFAAGAPDTPLGFAANERTTLPSELALAYAATGKTPAQPGFDQRWSSWTSAYGGSSTTSGNAAVGSNNVTARTYGFATGLDYRLTPTTLVGFALAGAGTNWGVANVLGTGRSDALQAGIYGTSWFGPAYVGGSLALTNHWFTTNRTALADQLSASFVGQSYGARLETGYRLHAWPAVAVTPYGAVQFEDLHTPAYGERDLSGGGFGLSYAARTATDIRTEMGARFDAPTHLFGQPLTFYGRLAWAHDFASTPALSAAFQALPGSAFVVNGAANPRDTALTTAGAQFALTPHLSLIAKFDGTFAGNSQTYAGSGTLHYAW